MLLGSKLCELSQAACCLVAEHLHASEHILSERRKLAEAVGTGKDTHRDIIVVRTYQIARAVAAVMTYIERTVTFWGGRQLFLRRTGISQIVAGRKTHIVSYLITGCLCFKRRLKK